MPLICLWFISSLSTKEYFNQEWSNTPVASLQFTTIITFKTAFFERSDHLFLFYFVDVSQLNRPILCT